jgi:hypothetical protein
MVRSPTVNVTASVRVAAASVQRREELLKLIWEAWRCGDEMSGTGGDQPLGA